MNCSKLMAAWLSSQKNHITVLNLSYYYLITVLFCPTTLLLCVRSEISFLLTILFLSTVLLLSYYCLILLFNTYHLHWRRNQLSFQNNLITVLEISYFNLITVLFSSSTSLLCLGRSQLVSILNCLRTVLFSSISPFLCFCMHLFQSYFYPTSQTGLGTNLL